MLAKCYSYGITGLDAHPIRIEVDVSRGLPTMAIVGLPDSAVKESKQRIRAAIKNSGYDFLARRITVNLAPADVKKEGPSFDLAMAVGLLAAMGYIDPKPLKDYAILGELSLDGNIQPIRGALPIAMSVARHRFRGLILPFANAAEAAIPNHVNVYPCKTLNDVVRFLSHPENVASFKVNHSSLFENVKNHDMDFSDVKGQDFVKRGLEVAAAGGHNVLLIGPPGSGKTMLAKRLMTILPSMSLEECLQTTKIHSVMGLVDTNVGIIKTRPFRTVHHTSSDIALIGGGSVPKPGEVTLAHNGILFLDELPEFHRNALEALRQPLEDNCVTVSRAAKTLRFPSRFMLICAMNPCPCGWYADPKKECHCPPLRVQKYLSKISGPLLDRIDIHLQVPSLSSTEIMSRGTGESSAAIKERTTRVRRLQQARAKTASRKPRYAITKESLQLLKNAIDELGVSARAHDRILKVARTIADLDDKEEIQPSHIAEAIQYRALDK